MIKKQIEVCGEGGYPIYRIPGVIVAANGNIIAYYECRHGNDWGVSDIAIKISSDGGNSFSERKIIVSGLGYNLVHSPIMFVKDNDIHFLWMKNYAECFHQVSHDNGLTFSEPVKTNCFEEFRSKYLWAVAAIGPGHGITLKNGRMIVGVWLALNKADRTKHRPSAIGTIYSDDSGLTWHAGDIVKCDLVNPSENVLAELEDGSILMNIRCENEYRRRISVISPDGISNWGNLKYEEDLPDPVCAAGLTQANGKLYFVNCNTEGFDKKEELSLLKADSRVDLSLKAFENGKWVLKTLIDPKGGYSDVYASEKHSKLVAIYEGGRKTDSEHWFQFDGLYVVTLDEYL